MLFYLRRNTNEKYSDKNDGNFYTHILTTGDGTLLMHPQSEFLSDGENLVNINTILEGKYLNAATTGKSFTDYDGSEKYIFQEGVFASDWNMMVVTPVSVYKQLTNKILTIFIIILVISSMIASSIVWGFSKQISKPIVKMQERVEAIQNLKISQTGQTERKQRKDEIGLMQLPKGRQ